MKPSGRAFTSSCSDRRRHIALVSETFPPDINGVANTLHYLCQELLAAGHSVTLVRPQPPADSAAGGAATVEQYPGRFHEIQVGGIALPKYSGLQMGLPSAGLLRASWRQNRPDQVYLATQGPLGWSAQRAANSLGIPVFAGFHTNFQTYSHYYGLGFLAPVIRLYLRLFHNRAGLTLVPTRQMQQCLSSLGVFRTAIWSRGVDCDRFSPRMQSPALREKWGVGEEELAVLYVGRLAPEKNLRQLIATFERLRAIHPRARLVLVGDGPLRADLATRHPDYIICGTQTGRSLAQHYASGDLLLFPSKTDTFGNVVLEAMASGLPVVAYQDGAAAEHIITGVSGLTAPLDHDEAFTQSALRLAERLSLRVQLGKAARQEALTLSWPLLAQQFLALTLSPLPEVARDSPKQGIPYL